MVDHQTLEAEAEAERQATGNKPEVEAEPGEARCHTDHGLEFSPAEALLAVVAGRVRRYALDLGLREISVSHEARLFTGPLKKALIIRDRNCRGPGCETPAHRCEADHIEPHSRGGPTTAANGQMLCKPCHRHKTKLQSLGLWPSENAPPN